MAAAVSTTIEDRVREVLRLLGDQLCIQAAYLFGSQVEGTADQWSDIDIAVFADGVEAWRMKQHLDFTVSLQMRAGEDIDLHLYSSSELPQPPAASFARWIVDHGVRIYP